MASYWSALLPVMLIFGVLEGILATLLSDTEGPLLTAGLPYLFAYLFTRPLYWGLWRGEVRLLPEILAGGLGYGCCVVFGQLVSE